MPGLFAKQCNITVVWVQLPCLPLSWLDQSVDEAEQNGSMVKRTSSLASNEKSQVRFLVELPPVVLSISNEPWNSVEVLVVVVSKHISHRHSPLTKHDYFRSNHRSIQYSCRLESIASAANIGFEPELAADQCGNRRSSVDHALE